MNSISLVGNLVADPDIFDTKNGKAGRIRIGVNTKIGEKEETLYTDVKMFGNTYRDIDAYTLVKGDRVSVQGRLVQESYTNKEGKEAVAHVVYATRVDKFAKRKKLEVAEPANDQGFRDKGF